MIPEWKDVQAYAGTLKTRSLVFKPDHPEQLSEILDYAKKNNLTICPRGNGYSYADTILNNGHIILDTAKLNRILHWDEFKGSITVEPGVRFADIFNIALASNWTLNACPGGMNVTIGGAVSNNVHGKDSWRVGNFGDQVKKINKKAR